MVEELLLSALFLAMGVEVLDSGRSCVSDANGDRARVDSLGDRVGVAPPPIIVVDVFNLVFVFEVVFVFLFVVVDVGRFHH